MFMNFFNEPSPNQHHVGGTKFRHFKTLDVSNNKISHLGKNLEPLISKLVHLNVSHNKIRSMKPVFSKANRLQSLDLSYNKLSDSIDRYDKDTGSYFSMKKGVWAKFSNQNSPPL